MINIRKNLFYLPVLRWATLIHVMVLFTLGMNVRPLYLFLTLFFYNMALTVFWQQVIVVIKKYPLLLQLDFMVTIAAIWLTGGTWQSPYYIYAFTSLMFTPFFLNLRDSLVATVVFSAFYTIGLLADGQTIPRVHAHRDFDTLISNYVAFFLTTIFFGYPANVIRQIEKATVDTADVKERLNETNEMLAIVEEAAPLSMREKEVLLLLSEGKTNAQIAEALYISEKTIKNHLYRAYRKLGVSSRSEAIACFRNKSTSEFCKE